MTLKSYMLNLPAMLRKALQAGLKSHLKKGFTLIELLVVIAIIGVLVAVGTANFVTAQRQARDASRRQTINTIQTAFEQYYATTGSVYPTGAAIPSAFDNNVTPTDPKNSAPYVFSWTTAASTYCICAMLEAGTGNSSSSACAWSTSGTYYCVINKQ